MFAHIKLLRTHQYIKNFFIFVPVFFGKQAGNLDSAVDAFGAFVAFCLLASAVYIFNDIRDVEYDRVHPKKCKRPLASGAVSLEMAWLMYGLFLTGAYVLFSGYGSQMVLFAGVYLVMNILYTLKLKQIPVLDVSIVAAGFVIRLHVGSLACGIPLSGWILVMTFMLALFIAFAKRRNDVLIMLETGIEARAVARHYSKRFLDFAIPTLSVLLVIAYVAFTLNDATIARYNTSNLWMTSVFVALGLLRYLYVTFYKDGAGSPTELVLTDRWLQGSVLLFFLFFLAVLYL